MKAKPIKKKILFIDRTLNLVISSFFTIKTSSQSKQSKKASFSKIIFTIKIKLASSSTLSKTSKY